LSTRAGAANIAAVLGSKDKREQRDAKDARDDAWNGPRFEYRVLNTGTVPAGQLERKLDEIGRAGWEGFASRDGMVLFKRLLP
jgi:hypothetical protein